MDTSDQQQLGRTFEAIDQFRCQARDAAGARCMVLEGRGKTGAVRAYLAAHTPVEGMGGATGGPILYLPVLPPATVAGLTAALTAEVFGTQDSAPRRGAYTGGLHRLVSALRDRAVALVILDDAQNLGLGLSNRLVDANVDWLKRLIKGTDVPVLLVGEGAGIAAIMGRDVALSHHSTARVHLAGSSTGREPLPTLPHDPDGELARPRR